jgi:2-keto-4-pentenoate hydratase
MSIDADESDEVTAAVTTGETTAVTEAVAAAADRLARAAQTRIGCAPVRDLITDVDAAYAVQQLSVSRQLALGRRVAGRKIGLTSVAVQRQLGVDRPDFGALYADDIHGDADPVDLGRFLLPRVEVEVAFVLGADLDLPHPSVLDVMRAVEFVLPAIEIVDSRIAGWNITLVDTVADNASGAATVLGAPVIWPSTDPFALDLRTCGALIEHRGEVVSVGAGAACLGNPLNAVTWLARELGRRGEALRAGDLVLSGALGPVVPVSAPGVYEARLEGLGSVRAVFDGIAPATQGQES